MDDRVKQMERELMSSMSKRDLLDKKQLAFTLRNNLEMLRQCAATAGLPTEAFDVPEGTFEELALTMDMTGEGYVQVFQAHKKAAVLADAMRDSECDLKDEIMLAITQALLVSGTVLTPDPDYFARDLLGEEGDQS